MPYNQQNGFTPRSFDDIMAVFMNAVNEVFNLEYDRDSFAGSNFYKFHYAGAQGILTAEATFAEAYAKLCDYLRSMNEKINIPKTPRDGLIAAFEGVGYMVSIEKQTAQNAGTVGLCVLMEDALDSETFQKKKAEILLGLKTYTDAGIFAKGEQRGEVALSNGQNFDFGFDLPLFHEVHLQLTVALSKNTSILPASVEVIKEKLLENLKREYRLGLEFEPGKYFTVSRDAPYAAGVSLLWRKNMEDAWSAEVYRSTYREYFRVNPERITVTLS